MVPCIDDTCSDMLSLWRDLLDVRSLLDVNSELLVGSAHDDGVSLAVMKRDGVADLVCSVPRTAAAMFAIGGGQAPRRYYYIMGKDVCARKVARVFGDAIVAPGNHETISQSSRRRASLGD